MTEPAVAVDPVDPVDPVDAVDAVGLEGGQLPAPEEAGGADPLWCGTYALYGDGRGGVVAVIQDGRTGQVHRYMAPPLVLRALRSRYPALRAPG